MNGSPVLWTIHCGSDSPNALISVNGRHTRDMATAPGVRHGLFAPDRRSVRQAWRRRKVHEPPDIAPAGRSHVTRRLRFDGPGPGTGEFADGAGVRRGVESARSGTGRPMAGHDRPP